VYAAVASWVMPALSLIESTPAQVAHASADLKRSLAFLEAHLKTRTWLTSERLTLADICVAAELVMAFQHVADEKFRAAFPNVSRWWSTVVNQANFKKVTGDIALCTKSAVFCADKFAENKKAHSQAKEPKEKKAKAEKPKAAEKPKVVEAEEEAEEDFADKPTNDPFADMPKGAWNMDEFKRTYSNEDTLTVAMPYFFDKFEKEFYSVWLCEYKYPAELTLTFMTSNLVGGMFQRIEKLRKNAFASMCVWGENNKNTIAGIWFWKGLDLAFPLCPDWMTDYESYEWTKLSVDDPKHKAMITQFFAWEGDFKGMKFNSGKIFK
jgi:elongation factor 1-gamma